MESILTCIKKMLGIDEDYTHFDPDITVYINGGLMILSQAGVGPETGFFIIDKEQKWTDFIGDRKDLEGIKSYIYLKVRLIFDPPTNSYVVDAMERTVKEFEWRLNSQAEYVPPITTTPTIS